MLLASSSEVCKNKVVLRHVGEMWWEQGHVSETPPGSDVVQTGCIYFCINLLQKSYKLCKLYFSGLWGMVSGILIIGLL